MYGVLWDMDGVLVSTGDAHWRAWTKTLTKRGIPFSYEQFQATFGMNNMGILQRLLGEDADPDLVREISEEKESQFRQTVKGNVALMDGVREWLERLDAWEAKQAVASSAPEANIDTLIDELGIRGYFDALVSGTDLPGKPEPDVFLKAARSIDVAPEQCVVIEDAVAGVEAARRAGMRCIAVTTTNPVKKLQGADVVVDRLDKVSNETFRQLLGG
jgi:beta-phosphoglucomutase family hydrolase